MRFTKWRPSDQSPAVPDFSRLGPDSGHIKRGFEIHFGEQPREGPGRHRLSASRRPEEQEMMAAGGGTFQRPSDGPLPPDFSQILNWIEGFCGSVGKWCLLCGNRSFKNTGKLFQMGDREYSAAAEGGGFGGISFRDEQMSHAFLQGGCRRRKDSRYSPDGTVELKLSDTEKMIDTHGVHLSRRDQDADRYGKVVGGSLLP